MSARNESKVIIANRNKLIGAALKNIIEPSGMHHVLLVTDSGKELLSKLKSTPEAIVILDMQLKNDNAYHLIKIIGNRYPLVKVMMFSSSIHPYAVKYMVKHCVGAYLSADSEPALITKAITDLANSGIHYNKLVNKKLYKDIISGEVLIPELTVRQMQFLKYSCTEMSYNEIAEKMKISIRTVDWYRDVMFTTFNLNNRTDLLLFALRTGLIGL